MTRAVWQISGGPASRAYAEVFLRHGVALIGPGDADREPRARRRGVRGQLRAALRAADLRGAVKDTEKAILQDLVGIYQSRQELARALGIDRSTLWRKLKRHRLCPPGK